MSIKQDFRTRIFSFNMTDHISVAVSFYLIKNTGHFHIRL